MLTLNFFFLLKGNEYHMLSPKVSRPMGSFQTAAHAVLGGVVTPSEKSIGILV